MKETWPTTENSSGNTRSGVITANTDFDAEQDCWVKIRNPFKINESDCRILDEIIRIQRYERKKRFLDFMSGSDRKFSDDSCPKEIVVSFNVIEIKNGYCFFDRRRMAHIIESDQNRRVYALEIPKLDGELPRSISELDALQILDLGACKRIPPWIHDLVQDDSEIVVHMTDNIWNNMPEAEDSALRLIVRPQILLSGAIGNLECHNQDEVMSRQGKGYQILNLAVLDLCSLSVKSLSLPIGLHSKTLDLSFRKSVIAVQHSIGRLKHLEELNLQSSSLVSLPGSIGLLSNLKVLNLAFTDNLEALPHSIGMLTHLEELNLQSSAITSLPTSIGTLSNLKILNLDCTKNLGFLPDSIGTLTNLKRLSLRSSAIVRLPISIGGYSNLEILDLGCTKNLCGLPESIGDLSKLKVLLLDGSWVEFVPASIGYLANLKFISLKTSKITLN